VNISSRGEVEENEDVFDVNQRGEYLPCTCPAASTHANLSWDNLSTVKLNCMVVKVEDIPRNYLIIFSASVKLIYL